MTASIIAPAHRGFRLTLSDDPDPIVLDPELTAFLVRLHLPKAIQANAPSASSAVDGDESSEPSMVDFGTIEWEDDEPDYQFGELTLTAAQIASLLASAVVDAIRQSLAYEREHGVLSGKAQPASEPSA